MLSISTSNTRQCMGIGSGGRGKNSPLHTFWANTLRAEFLDLKTKLRLHPLTFRSPKKKLSLPYFPSHSHASTVLDIEVNRYMNNINKSGFTPRFLVRFKLLIFLVSCFSCFALFVFVLCLVYPMLPVSMDCPFLIVPLRFSVTFLYYLHCICIKYKGTLRSDHD